jgi:hypothetical protein
MDGIRRGLEDLEAHTAIQIAAHKQRIERLKNAPAATTPPRASDTIRDIRPNDPFRRLRH